jgi:hypothetical protein
MWIVLLAVFVALVAFGTVFAVIGVRRDRSLRGLEDPLAPRTQDDGAHGVQTAQAKAARPDSGVGGFTAF